VEVKGEGVGPKPQQCRDSLAPLGGVTWGSLGLKPPFEAVSPQQGFQKSAGKYVCGYVDGTRGGCCEGFLCSSEVQCPVRLPFD
jgi:hypothetical protein